MSIRRLLGLKQPAPSVMTPPQSPIKPQTLEAVFGVESLSSASPAAPQAPTGVSPKIGPLPFRSETCSSHHFLLACYQYWCNEFKEPPRYHRKQWEFVYILHALWERGMLAPEKRGLGFGVGREPLTAVMAARGCSVTATDLEIEAQTQTAWAATNEHSAALSDLNERGICDENTFLEKVTFVPANMNDIPSDLQDFDFCWSACCFEHLGSIEAGLAFYKNSLETLKPGGFAIHTTEFNLSSNTETLDNAHTVLFRKRDIDAFLDELRGQGHYCEPLLIHHGAQPVDGFIDMAPYRDDPHLRLALEQYVTTSVGIITRKTLD